VFAKQSSWLKSHKIQADSKEKQNNQIDLPPCSISIFEASYDSVIKPLHFPVMRNDDIKKLHDHPLIAKIPMVKCFVNESHYRDECQKSDYIQRQQFQQSCSIGSRGQNTSSVDGTEQVYLGEETRELLIAFF
jgi:hypothetical protein